MTLSRITLSHDLLCVGRVSIDLFSEQVGAPFETIESFSTSVGGSPANIAIGTARLGCASALLTAVGTDKVGDFVTAYLQNAGVETSHVYRKPNARTGMAVVGVEPPADFPLTFYRENPADIWVDLADAAAVPVEQVKILLLSGTALSRGTMPEAVFALAERASASSVEIWIDLDYRPDQWDDPRAYGVWMRRLLPHLDVVLGTEEELFQAFAPNPAAPITQDALLEMAHLLQKQGKTVVLKRGANGVSLFTPDAAFDVAGLVVEVVNTVGAGDGFASGLLFSRLRGDDWQTAVRFGNACGAIVVGRNGCATALPTLSEVETMLGQR